jgi:hypothetical protein
MDSLPREKDLFLVSPQQICGQKVFWIERKLFDRLSRIKAGWENSFLAVNAAKSLRRALLWLQKV